WAAAKTSCEVIWSKPGSVAWVWEKEVRLAGFRMTMLFELYGPFRAGSVGPKIATTGTPSAAARCRGPVSPPMKRLAWRVSEMSSPREQVIGCAAPSDELRTVFANG